MQVASGGFAVVIRSLCEERNERLSRISLVAANGACRPLSPESMFAHGPRPSPDGTRIAFLAANSAAEPSRLWLADADGTAARALALPSGFGAVRTATWSPDGLALCIAVEVPVDDLGVAAEREWLARHPAAAPAPPLRRHTSRRTRTDGVGDRERRAQIFALPIGARATAIGDGAQPLPLDASDFDDFDPAWSPDGRTIAFVSNRSTDGRITSEQNLWLVDVARGGARQVTAGFWLWGPLAWSPDGTRVACYGMRGLHVPLAIRLLVIAVDDGAIAASEGIGAHIWPQGAPAWLPDGSAVLAAGVLGSTGRVFAFDPHSGRQRDLVAADAVFGVLALVDDGASVAVTMSTARSPSALVLANANDGAVTPVLDLNAGWLDDVTIAPHRLVAFTADDGLEISGWLVTPLSGDAPFPCILDVHYGPNAAWGPGFAVAAQINAGRGFATLLLNPRGSTGYGDAFAAAADFGGADFADLCAGLDALVAAGEIDGERLGILGLSYGGFMASWAIARTSRFRAAVSINGIANQFTWYLTSDTGLFFYRNRFGDPFAGAAAMETYWRHSPIAYAAAIATPLLLVQSEDDLRCPIDQGEQLFGALVAQHKTVELIRVPRAAHDLMGTAAPHHAYLVHRAIGDWFARFLGPRERSEGDRAVTSGSAVPS